MLSGVGLVSGVMWGGPKGWNNVKFIYSVCKIKYFYPAVQKLQNLFTLSFLYHVMQKYIYHVMQKYIYPAVQK